MMLGSPPLTTTVEPTELKGAVGCMYVPLVLFGMFMPPPVGSAVPVRRPLVAVEPGNEVALATLAFWTVFELDTATVGCKVMVVAVVVAVMVVIPWKLLTDSTVAVMFAGTEAG